MTSTPVGRIVIRPSDETKAIIGITKGADPSLKPGMVYEIRKDASGVMTLHEVGESCIRGPVAAEDTRQDAVFSWAHDLGLIFDAMGIRFVATIDEKIKYGKLIGCYDTRNDLDQNLFFLRGTNDTHHHLIPVIASALSRPRDIDTDLAILFRVLDDGDLDAAQAKIEEFKKKYANIPELSKAEVMISRRISQREKAE